MTTVLKAALECRAAVRVNPADAMPYTLDLWGLPSNGLLLNERSNSRLPECGKIQDLRMRVGGIPFQFESMLLKRNDDGSSLWSIPLFLRSGEGRSHMRIEVPSGFELKGEFASAMGGAKFTVNDVSHIGAKIQLCEEVGGLAVSGSSIKVFIEESTNIAQLDGSIMWRTGDRCGLYFPDMRRVNPEDSMHPWIRICHRVLLEQVLSVSASEGARAPK